MSNNQIKEDIQFMMLAEKISKNSNCIRANYGSIIVKKEKIISTGFNRNITLQCNQIGKCIREEKNIEHGTRYEIGDCLHSEMDAILSCAREGKSCKDATLYLNGIPCSLCARHIIVSGITRVVFKMPDDPRIYPLRNGLKLLKDKHLEVVIL